MKNKTFALLLFFLSLAFLPSAAIATPDTLNAAHPPVKRWSIDISAGYGFPVAREVLGAEEVTDSNSTTTGHYVRGTYGKGMIGFVSAGYIIKQHFGVEAGIFSCVGKNIQTLDWKALPPANFTNQKFMQVNSNGLMLGFFLSDTIRKLRLSIHNDLLLGIYNNGQYKTVTVDSANTVKTSDRWKYYGGTSYGWMGKLSAAYPLSAKLHVGVQAFFLLHSWSPAKGENGGKQYSFTDDIDYNGIVLTTSDKLPRITFPLHAAGAVLFIGFSF